MENVRGKVTSATLQACGRLSGSSTEDLHHDADEVSSLTKHILTTCLSMSNGTRSCDNWKLSFLFIDLSSIFAFPPHLMPIVSKSSSTMLTMPDTIPLKPTLHVEVLVSYATSALIPTRVICDEVRHWLLSAYVQVKVDQLIAGYGMSLSPKASYLLTTLTALRMSLFTSSKSIPSMSLTSLARTMHLASMTFRKFS